MQSITSIITLAQSTSLSTPFTQENYFIAAIAFIIGIIITWLICSGSKKATIAKFSAELEAEKNRVIETKQRLTSSQQDLKILSDSEASLKQEHDGIIAKLTAEQKAAKEKELSLQDIHTKLEDTFKTLSSEALKANQEQFLQFAKTTQQQTAAADLDQRKDAVAQMIQPVTNTLDKVEQRISSIGELVKTRESAYTSLNEQVKQLADTQQELQKETSLVNKALQQLNQMNLERSHSGSDILPIEALRPLDPMDSFVDDEDANDFSTEALDDDFEGFTAETPGDGI